MNLIADSWLAPKTSVVKTVLTGLILVANPLSHKGKYNIYQLPPLAYV